jgi:hypothetical protein
MMKKIQLDSSVATRDAESEIAAGLGHRHRVTPCCPLAPSQAPCYAIKGVMHTQVEVLADNEFEEVHQVIPRHQLFLLFPLFPLHRRTGGLSTVYTPHTNDRGSSH